MATGIAPATTSDPVGWRFENSYAGLPGVLFAAIEPDRVKDPRVAVLNRGLAADLGLNIDTLTPEDAAAMFAGQRPLTGSRPIAQAYAGHQFGGFTMLGDGRAILLGEHRAPDGRLVDIQFKGSGRTRFSRGGDGKAALGPMLREYIISEAMAALGIPTTRSLAVVTTGEPVYRETIRRGAILTRVAASHIRVGTFEYALRLDHSVLRSLADYTIARHYPELAESPGKYLEFYRTVSDRQAALVARWMLVGFVHGVMNTDNVAISGETIDYGPCAFMNAYDPATVFSSIDQGGRYAYGNQPRIMQWNLARLGETLLPLIDEDPGRAIEAATQVLEEFLVAFEGYWFAGMLRKLGLVTKEEGDADLARSLLNWMQGSRADFTNTFRDLSAGELDGGHYQDAGFRAWYARWLERIGLQGLPIDEVRQRMRSVNPAVIPRNHLVEEALLAAEEQEDLSILHRLLGALATPFGLGEGMAGYREPPADESGYRTYCGT
ncbi:MAG: YdiU family protein [Isosphaeraceae bacterium]